MHFYGSKARPKAIFGKGTKELAAFYKAQFSVAPGACELMNILLMAWQPGALHHAWTLPDLYKADVAVIQTIDKKIEIDELDHASFTYRFKINKGTKEGVSLAANTIHSIDGFIVRELCRRCNFDRDQLIKAEAAIIKHLNNSGKTVSTLPIEKIWEKTGFVSLVGIEHLDNIKEMSLNYAMELLSLIQATLKNKSFEVVTVHDEFKCHPNNMNRLRLVYIELFAELAESTLIDNMLLEITGKPVKIPRIDARLGDKIRQAEYPLS